MFLTTLVLLNSVIEHSITNECDFNVIRFKKNTVKCIDNGVYAKLCNHYSLPDEFKVIKEKGLNNIDHFEFEPKRMIREIGDNKKIMAEFEYDFICKKNQPAKLELNIYPKPNYDLSPGQEIAQMLIVIILVITFIIICGTSTKSILLLHMLTHDSNSKTYCE